MAIELTMATDTAQPAKAQTAEPRARAARRWSFGGRVSAREIIAFSSQLSLMLEVGTSLTDAMRALELQTTNPVLRAIVHELYDHMQEGASFSVALGRHPEVFDGVFTSMVRAGETGGYLREALNRLVEMQEKREALRAHVRAALTYPSILGVMSFLVIVFVITGVLPKFLPIFEGKEALLPASTRLLLLLSHLLRTYWWACLLGVAGCGAGLRALLLSAPGRRLRDAAALRLPVIGPLTNQVLTCQLLRTLGHLLESRVPLLDALAVARPTIANRFYQALTDRVSETVQRGGRLAQAFTAFQYMTPAVRQMIATGEEAGHLYPVMLRLAKHYDVEIEQTLKRLSAMIEPIALVLLGSIVGIIVASVILPLFKLAHAIG